VGSSIRVYAGTDFFVAVYAAMYFNELDNSQKLSFYVGDLDPI